MRRTADSAEDRSGPGPLFDIFDAKPSQPETEPFVDDATIQARFEAFHEANPNVYRLLVKFALQARDRTQRFGIAAIWERMRWEMFIETHGDDDFKLNNDYRSRYARLIMQNEPELADFFEVRSLRAE